MVLAVPTWNGAESTGCNVEVKWKEISSDFIQMPRHDYFSLNFPDIWCCDSLLMSVDST